MRLPTQIRRSRTTTGSILSTIQLNDGRLSGMYETASIDRYGDIRVFFTSFDRDEHDEIHDRRGLDIPG